MKSAYRGHYQPASSELIPWADPYIAGLVARCVAQPLSNAGHVSSGGPSPDALDAGRVSLAAARQEGSRRQSPTERSTAPRRLHTGRSSAAAMTHGW